VTGVTPHLANLNSTENNFAAVTLGEEPPTLALALAPALVATPVHGAMVDTETEDRIAASTAILALDPAAQTGRPKVDTEENTTLPPVVGKHQVTRGYTRD
jgi:hypothetical protein